MDADRFDLLSRVVFAGGSRRGIGRALAGFVLAAPWPFLLDQTMADAKKKRKKRKKHKKKKKCKGGQRRCGKKCFPAGSCCANAECGDQGACVNGRCLCSGGLKTCGDRCIAADGCCSDAECQIVGSTCQSGVCRCPAGQSNSGGVCGTIPIDCFEPVVPCETNEQCCSGDCVLTDGQKRCQPSAQGEPCVRTDYCAPGLVCVGFTCRTA